MDFSTLLFRAHATGSLMTEPKTKEEKEAGLLSETTKTYLRKIHREIYWNRKAEYSNKYIEKGLSEEEAAITLLSRFRKKILKKNDIRLHNDFFTGEPDGHDGETINTCEEGFDTKCSFDAFTFPYCDDKVNKDYYWQAQTYMDLTGAKKWTVAYCLVNTPVRLITKEQEFTYYKMNCPHDESPEFERYLQRLIDIEKCLIFDLKEFKKENPNHDLYCKEWTYDIPIKERVIEHTFERDDKDIQRLKERAESCRKWLENYHNKYYPTLQ